MKNLIIFLCSAMACLKTFSQAKDTTLFIYFSSNSYVPDAAEKNNLLNSLQSIDSIIGLTGFADTVGTKQYNKRLSERRAAGVTPLLSNNNFQYRMDKMAGGETTAFGKNLSSNRVVQIKATLKSRTAANNSTIVNIASPAQQNELNTNQQPAAITIDTTQAVIRLTLNKIYFEPDKPVITEDSYPYVDELVRVLKFYADKKIEIVGHINYQGIGNSAPPPAFVALSAQRAKAVYDLLIEAGLPAGRMTYKGVGNTQQAFPHPKSEEEMRKNMRVEIFLR